MAAKSEKDKLIQVPPDVFNFISEFGVDAIYDIIKGSTGDNYYLCDVRVNDRDLKEGTAENIQEWAEKQKVNVLLNLINGIACKIDAKLPSTSIARIGKNK